MMRRVCSALIVLSVLALTPLDAAAQRPMGIVDIINVPRLGDPQVSPDGASIVYTMSVADWKANKRITHVWRVPFGGGTPVQLTRGEAGEQSPRWSPDGLSIAFLAKRDENAPRQAYLLPVEGGEARALTSHATDVSDIAWSPDGATLFFTASDEKSSEEQARLKAKDDVFAFDENYEQTHLWTVTVASGAESRVTSGDYSIVGYRLSDDGTKLVVERAPNPLLGSRDRVELMMMNADGSGSVALTDDDVGESGAAISPDNSRVIFIADANERFETYYNGRLFEVPAGGGAARVLVGGNVPYDITSAEWSTDGTTIYFVANMGVHQELFALPAAGGPPRQITDGPHAVQAWSELDDRHVFTMPDAASPGEIWTLAKEGAPVQVTHVFDYLARDFAMGRQEAITWKGADGTTVEGLLTYPVGYAAGTRYPLAVLTHGGPQAADKYSIGSPTYAIQVLAGKGYAVLQPNYRGSTGYGDAFERDMVGHYFQNAHLDVMTGVDEVIERGVADPDRLVKAGWSGGGHMTNWLITFTDRFKAAASGAGAANWISMYAQSDIRSYRTPWFGGTPWQKDAPIDIYWDHSPLKYVSNVKTPTIFFVGQNDPRVPMPQSVEMYRALTSNGIPTHLYVAPREPHGWGELRHQLFKANVELAWFAKYALQQPYAWEKAPQGDSE